jgi:hypothetical protein
MTSGAPSVDLCGRNPVDQRTFVQVLTDEIGKFGVNWAPLKAGLFDGSLTRLNAVKAGFDRLVTKVRLTYS